MQQLRNMRFLFIVSTVIVFASCNVFSKPKTGCPSNGKNVGAEMLFGDTKNIPKAKKFRN